MIDLIEEIGIVTKKKASTNGGEYFSPCPFCKDGKDRFLIWPNQFNKNGEYQGGRFLCARSTNRSSRNRREGPLSQHLIR